MGRVFDERIAETGKLLRFFIYPNMKRNKYDEDGKAVIEYFTKIVTTYILFEADGKKLPAKSKTREFAKGETPTSYADLNTIITNNFASVINADITEFTGGQDG